ncbi:MAG: carboxypeptidase-like regulatory domain-containing protein [Kofleriaceae bacterium]
MRWLVLAALAACATEPAGRCEQAADHVLACTSADLGYRGETICDGAKASAILNLDCDTIAALAADAKERDWWPEFLCALDLGTCESTNRVLVGLVQRNDGTPAPNVYVRAVSPGNDYAPVYGAWTVAGGGFAIHDLAPQRYRIEVAMLPTGGTLSAIDVTPEQAFVAVAAPIR